MSALISLSSELVWIEATLGPEHPPMTVPKCGPIITNIWTRDVHLFVGVPQASQVQAWRVNKRMAMYLGIGDEFLPLSTSCHGHPPP